MSLFQCEKCGCVDNTSRAFYHTRNAKWWPPEFKGKQLCSVCGPPTYSDGSPTEYGKWAGARPPNFYKLGSLFTDEEGNVRVKATNQYPTKEDQVPPPEGYPWKA